MKTLLFALLTIPLFCCCTKSIQSIDGLSLKDSIVCFDTIKAQIDELCFSTEYYNKSKDPIYILSIDPECGCTYVECTKDTIYPKETGEFIIYYDSYTHSFDVELPIDISYRWKEEEYKKTIYLFGYVIPRVIE